MKNATPYLNFAGNTEQAFAFYRSVFGGDYLSLVRFRDFPGNPMRVPEDQLDKIAHMALPIGPDSLISGTDVLDGWQPLTVGNNFYIALETDDADEAKRVFSALSDGGQKQMELQKTDWAELYGTCTDRFAVQWMVMYTGGVIFP